MKKTASPPSLETWCSDGSLYREGDLLKSIDLELSRICNQHCRYCFTDAGKSLDGELTLSEIKRIILEGKELGVKQIVIVGGGEPLLYKNLKAVIDFILEKELQVILLTNGTLIDRSYVKYFYTRGIHVVVKLNALKDEDVHDYLVGNKGSFRKVNKAIEMFLSEGYGKSGAPKLAVESIICKINVKEIPLMWRWARDNHILPFFELITPQGRAVSMFQLFLSSKEAYELFSQLSEIDRYEYGYEWIPTPPIAGFSCRRNYYSCYINSTGDVFPCAGIGIVVGNVRKNSLRSILENSYLIRKLRKAEEYLEGNCRTCILKKECYGCRGKAFWVSGNPFAEDPICWYKGNNKIILEELKRE